MDRWVAAEADRLHAALDADNGVSPLPCCQLLFEWGVSAMRHGDLDRAEAILVELDAILPAHVPGRGHRAEVALARGQLDRAMALIMPLLEISDDPEYRAIYAEILAARGDRKLQAKRNVPLQRTSCCWRDGPKPLPTTRRPSSWALATNRSARSKPPWPTGSSATRRARAAFWPGHCVTRSKSRR